MELPSTEILDVIIIGAGHAGLSVSYYLQQNNISHVIFERGRIGESWRSQRWNSFAINSPIKLSILPGDSLNGSNPDGFYLKDEFVCSLDSYASKFHLPVKKQSTVISLERVSDGDVFLVKVKHDDEVITWKCRQAVIASGIMSAPKIPRVSSRLSGNICSIHAAEYREPAQLPQGNTLVVGSGQSGCQIVEDLIPSGRKVYFSTSKVGRVPRRYRGKDILEWFVETKFMDVSTDSVTDPKIINARQPQVSGTGPFGHTVSLQGLSGQGVIILGSVKEIENGEIHFNENASENVRFADEFSETIKKMIDGYIAQHGLHTNHNQEDPADLPDPLCACASHLTSLDLKANNITSVIWTTGYSGDFSWIKLPVTDPDGKPIHHNGISPVSGIYFIGFPWLRSRKSGVIYGMHDDAPYIANCIIQNMRD